MKKVVLIIQARMGSTRLPGKSMMDLAGVPLVGRILERVKRTKRVDEIVLATSNNSKDKILEDLANKYKISCFCGSENDLVDRYYQAAKYYRADVILRLPADNPCPEPTEFDKLIKFHLSNNYDFSSNICNFMGNGYPDGIGVEAFNFSSLKTIWENEKSFEKREHIHLNYYNYLTNEPPKNSSFSVGTIICPKQYSRPELVLDVNTQMDYEFIKQLYEYLYPRNPKFGIIDIIQWYDNIYTKEK